MPCCFNKAAKMASLEFPYGNVGALVGEGVATSTPVKLYCLRISSILSVDFLLVASTIGGS